MESSTLLDSVLPSMLPSTSLGVSSSGTGDMSSTGNGTSHRKNPRMRARTKTGCLTCRKRRIKCGEERPTCVNCVKSKRHCEGYNQRVVFKPLIGEWPGQPSVLSGPLYYSSMLPGTRDPGYRARLWTPSSQDNTLTSIRPQMSTEIDYSNVETKTILHMSPSNQHVLVGNPIRYSRGPDRSLSSYSPFWKRQPASQKHDEKSSYYQHSSVSTHIMKYPQDIEQGLASNQYDSNSQIPDRGPHTGEVNLNQAGSSVKCVPQHAAPEQRIAKSASLQNEPELHLSDFNGDRVNPMHVLDEAAVEYEDDDYWDVLSDEEMTDKEDANSKDIVEGGQDSNLIRLIQYEDPRELAIRQNGAFMYGGTLADYKVENVASPLKNSKTARVFAYFIHVTGPSLSLYERNPRNPASISEGATPPSLLGLWGYTLPMKALNHQGLLHAMLALASLHIARLQKASVTPSYKHYAYALKRLSRSLGHPKKRLMVQTLATSLLLAYYEAMTSEHTKCSAHLTGVARLFAELDFRSLTEEAQSLKPEQAAQMEQFPYQNSDRPVDQSEFEKNTKESLRLPDESMVSIIVGKKVSYSEFGRVVEDTRPRQVKGRSTAGNFDLKSYETLQDLHWWYARQDAFQSIVSENPLIMAYQKWTDCPPRAPLGCADALFGHHDHITLLIGRIADFTARDRERKRAQVDADGGNWRPAPGMPGTGPSASQGQGQAHPFRTSTAPMSPLPHMQVGPSPEWNGPPIPPVADYTNPNFVLRENSRATPIEPQSKWSNLPAAYDAALNEWTSISEAHTAVTHFLANIDVLESLTPDLYSSALGENMTPFGPAIIHRSYSVSILWTLLHLAKILLLRSHPAMPAATMVASSLCATATQPYATLIGRIAAGMQIPTTDATSLNPSLSAALIESTTSLFFAGIQYQDPKQRDWLIKRLLEIDRRTGWAPAGVIARSCETSWERAAELGRGPPYNRHQTEYLSKEGLVNFDYYSAADETLVEHGVVQDSPSKEKGYKKDEWTKEPEKQEGDDLDRRFVIKREKEMLPFAMNLLGVSLVDVVKCEALSECGELESSCENCYSGHYGSESHRHINASNAGTEWLDWPKDAAKQSHLLDLSNLADLATHIVKTKQSDSGYSNHTAAKTSIIDLTTTSDYAKLGNMRDSDYHPDTSNSHSRIIAQPAGMAEYDVSERLGSTNSSPKTVSEHNDHSQKASSPTRLVKQKFGSKGFASVSGQAETAMLKSSMLNPAIESAIRDDSNSVHEVMDSPTKEFVQLIMPGEGDLLETSIAVDSSPMSCLESSDNSIASETEEDDEHGFVRATGGSDEAFGEYEVNGINALSSAMNMIKNLLLRELVDYALPDVTDAPNGSDSPTSASAGSSRSELSLRTSNSQTSRTKKRLRDSGRDPGDGDGDGDDSEGEDRPRKKKRKRST